MAGSGGDAEDLAVIGQQPLISKTPEELGIGIDLLLPISGGPEALVFLGEWDVVAARGVAGGFGEAEEADARVGGGGYAGLRGLEDEEEEDDCSDSNADNRELVE